MHSFVSVSLETSAIQEIQFELASGLPDSFDSFTDNEKLAWLDSNSRSQETFFFEPYEIRSIKELTLQEIN